MKSPIENTPWFFHQFEGTFNVIDVNGEWVARKLPDEATARLIAASPAMKMALKIHHENSINTQPEYSGIGSDRVAFVATELALKKSE